MHARSQQYVEIFARALLGCLLLVCVGEAIAQVQVRGYTRKDGTYVAPHVRSSPNSSMADNYSARGNFNPYTGARGTVDPGPPVYGPRPARLSWPPLAPAYQQPAYRQVYAPAPQAQAPPVIFRCTDAAGGFHYIATPRAGCDEVVVNASPSQAMPNARYMPTARSSRYGGRCAQDCSGHDAGYEWAEDRGIEDPDDCGAILSHSSKGARPGPKSGRKSSTAPGRLLNQA